MCSLLNPYTTVIHSLELFILMPFVYGHKPHIMIYKQTFHYFINLNKIKMYKQSEARKKERFYKHKTNFS